MIETLYLSYNNAVFPRLVAVSTLRLAQASELIRAPFVTALSVPDPELAALEPRHFYRVRYLPTQSGAQAREILGGEILMIVDKVRFG